MKKVINETRRKGNADEVLVLSHYEQDGVIFVDLDVLTKDGRINMARIADRGYKTDGASEI